MARAFRAKPCITCGAIFFPNGPNARYCDGCRDEARRKSFREHYHRRREADPDYNRARHVKALKRALDNGSLDAARAVRRKADSAYKKRILADPDRAAEVRAYGAKWRREARRAFQESDPDGYAEFVAKLREEFRDYRREWARKRRAGMTDAEKSEALAKRRAWLAERELRALQAEIHGRTR